MAFLNIRFSSICARKIHPIQFSVLHDFWVKIKRGQTRTLHAVSSVANAQSLSLTNNSHKLSGNPSENVCAYGGLSVIFRRCYCVKTAGKCGPVTGVMRDGRHVAPPWRILFFGSDSFGIAGLHALNLNR
jgi:hypothetical protein